MPPGQTAVCSAWGCRFGSGDASWSCDTVVCECPNGCASDGQDYKKTFEGVRGEVTLDCDEKSDKCLLNVSARWMEGRGGGGWAKRACRLGLRRPELGCCRRVYEPMCLSRT